MKVYLKYLLCLISSFLLNLFLLYLLIQESPESDLSWSRKPARDAEAVASLNCSGHGRAFLDGLLDDHGTPVCACYSCYMGPNCSDFHPQGCPLYVYSVDPMFLEAYWRQHEEEGGVMTSTWHRMSYYFTGTTTNYISTELDRHIRLLHTVVGNANTQGKFIVLGVGAMQLVSAALYALSGNLNASGSPARVVARVPYYPVYRLQSELLKGFEWSGDASQWENVFDESINFVEFVASPNNPDGEVREAVLKGPSVKAIYDRVYYWPHYTAITSPADEDIMIFSLGKATGHAGSRLGWAIIKDEGMYQRFVNYIEFSVASVSYDTQLRALMIIKAALRDDGKELFGFGHKTLRNNWERLKGVISHSKRFSLQKLSPQYCTYFQTIRVPSPAMAWLKCEREEDKDCHAVINSVGVIGDKGNVFGAESKYVRLSLSTSPDDSNLFMKRIETLVAEEEGPRSI